MSWQRSFWITLAIAFLCLGLLIWQMQVAENERAERIELEQQVLAYGGALLNIKYGLEGEVLVGLGFEAADINGGFLGVAYLLTFDSLAEIAFQEDSTTGEAPPKEDSP